MLNQHTEEAFDGSVKSAVHHEWLLASAVFGYVFEFEALGQVEVELHGRKLPQTADGIHKFDIDFWAVKRGFAGDGLVFDIEFLENFFERLGRHVPLLFAA